MGFGWFLSLTLYGTDATLVRRRRFGDALEEAHSAERLTKFEELLEAAVDLDRIPDEYLICAAYDSGLQVRRPARRPDGPGTE